MLGFLGSVTVQIRVCQSIANKTHYAEGFCTIERFKRMAYYLTAYCAAIDLQHF